MARKMSLKKMGISPAGVAAGVGLTVVAMGLSFGVAQVLTGVAGQIGALKSRFFG